MRRTILMIVIAAAVLVVTGGTSTADPPPAETFHGLVPARLADTRASGQTVDGASQGGGALGPGGVLTVPVVGRGGVPAFAVGAVALNVTAINPTAASFLTVYPTGETRPNASNLNLAPGRTLPNMVIVPVGAGGAVTIYNDRGTTNVAVDVLGWFPRTNHPPTTVLVSMSNGGIHGNSHSTVNSVSADGRYIAFESDASNLVPFDSNGQYDIFVRDVVAGTTERVSVSSTGFQGNGHSHHPSISADGRYVAFHSSADNLVTGDTNGVRDVFVHDRQTKITSRVSISSTGFQGSATSDRPCISGNGRYVSFESAATNLVTGDSNGKLDVFVHDRLTSQTTRVSIGSNGAQSDGDSVRSSMSANGRYVAFQSTGNTLVVPDLGGSYEIYVHDRTTSVTSRVNVTPGGTQVVGQFTSARISADGRHVTFASSSSTLVPGDTNGVADVFVHDRTTRITTLVSVSTEGEQTDLLSDQPAISADGRYVAFHSNATNLVADDDNGLRDIFVHDLATSTTTRVSVSSTGLEGTSQSLNPSISATGRFVVFYSSSVNLVPGGSSGNQVFVRDRGTV